MKKIICLLIMSSFMVSCVTRKACDRKFQTYDTDSVSIVTNTNTVIRDTTIYVKIPGDTVFQSLPSDQVSTIKTGIASSTAWVQDGKLNHHLQQDDAVVTSTIKGALTRIVSQTGKVSFQKRIEYINKLSGWQVFQIYFGRVSLVFFLMILMVWIYKAKKQII